MRNHSVCRVVSLFLFIFVAVSLALAAERSVDLTAPDGTKLKASYFAAGKSGPGVLLLHQCNRDRKIWGPLPQQLAAAGINVLTVDMRGFGESGDKPRASASQQEVIAEEKKWPDDIDVAFQYLQSQPGVEKSTIGVGGASCGVNNSVQTAIRHPEVRSLVLLSGPTNYFGRKFLRSSTIPIFFAYADDDEFKPTPMEIQWLYSITSTPDKKLVHYSTGGHGADMFKVHPELMGLITDWYVTTLIKTPGKAPATKDVVAASGQIQMLNLIEQPGGVAEVEAKLKQARAADPKAILFPEAQVNLIGYEHLLAGDTKGAVEIMKLNVLAYPNSPNAYDSLGDAYLADGQKELAAESAKKALALLSSDTADDQQTRDAIKASADQKLKQLEKASQ